MSTLELRHLITEYLSHIDDVSFLKAIKTILESKVSESVYHLTDDQKKRIDQAREQIRKRKTIPDKDVQREVEVWLNSK